MVLQDAERRQTERFDEMTSTIAKLEEEVAFVKKQQLEGAQP